MNDFIKALNKRGSMTCVTKERYGRVAIDFVSRSDMVAFWDQANRAIYGKLVILDSMLASPMSKEDARLFRNIEAFSEALREYGKQVEYKEITLPEVEQISHEENDGQVRRFQMIWEFESGPKAADLFQRFIWLLEGEEENVSITAK